MASIHRVRVTWNGIPSGPGVSTFYCEASAVPNLTQLRLALANLATAIAPGVSLQIENQGDTISDADGALVGSWSTTAQAAIPSTATGNYSAPVGGVVAWQTAGIHNGKRLQGRTFVVPLAHTQFGADGKLLPGAVGNLSGLGNGLRDSPAPKWVVWGRPKKPRNADGSVVEGSVATGGMSSIITGYKVPSRAMVLTSRRD